VTRYFCVDPSHALQGDPASVDVTAQVRLEREFMPRESAYLADSRDVVRRVRDLRSTDPNDRIAAVRRILTGTSAPLDAPVVLIAGDRIDRVPGLYEMDELRRSERAVAVLLDRYGQPNLAREGSDDIVVLRDEPPAPIGPSGTIVQPPPPPAPETVAVRRDLRTEATVLPQGVYPVLELSTRLADAAADEGAIVTAIHDTPSFGSVVSNEVRTPWRVVVECPVATGQPPANHLVVFTGTGEPEPAEVLGVPAVGGDVVLERVALQDAVPPIPATRAERRLRVGLLGAAIVATTVLIVTWLSGGLALAARETPVWLGLAVVLTVAGFAVGLITLASRSDAEGNANDMFVLRRHYASRMDMMWYATIATAGLFALAAAAGFVPPILSADAPVPAAAITFDASQRIVTATVEVATSGLSTDDPVTIEMRQYPAEAAAGILIGRVASTGDPAGSSVIREVVSLDRGARYMSVLVTEGDDPVVACSPTDIGGPGCTVVSVPPLGAGVVRFAPAAPIDLGLGTTAPAVPTSSVPTLTPAPSFSPASPAASPVSPAISSSATP
jgi:hypothetical protein